MRIALLALFALQTATFAQQPEDPIYRLPPFEVPVQTFAPNSIKSETLDYGHTLHGTQEAWKKSRGKGAVVAVTDTGMNVSHPDLKDQILKSVDFTNSRSGFNDIQGHGTHCGGIIAAADNGSGVTGIAPHAKLLNVKVLGDDGSGFGSWIAKGVSWAADNGADVISMSLGSSQSDKQINDAIKYAVEKGCIVIVAAGNEGPRDNSVSWPGRYSIVVCVAAVDSNKVVAGFSSRGPEVDIAAAGVQVLSTYKDGHAKLSGTSMAAPQVAGIAALYVSYCKQLNRKHSAKEFTELLYASAEALQSATRNQVGNGLARADALLAMITPEQPKPPVPAPQEDTFIFDFLNKVITLPPGWTAKPAPKQMSSYNYSDVLRFVQEGNRATVFNRTPVDSVPTGLYCSVDLPGYDAGKYECWNQNGVAMFRKIPDVLQTTLPTPTTSVSASPGFYYTGSRLRLPTKEVCLPGGY